MMPSGQWIVDASVALKWHLRDEQYLPQADSLFNAFKSGQAQLLAPSFIRYEIANALLVAHRRGRIGLETARDQLRDFLSLAIHQAGDSNGLVNSATELASGLDITVYDALYLSLARESASNFITADRQLYDKVTGSFPQIVWIENLPMSAP